MGCGSKCIKIVLILFNILFWIFGLGVLAVGVWMKVDVSVANLGAAANIGLTDNIIEIAAWVFIGSGIFAFIVGFIGCCGTVRESRVLLGLYICCLIVIFAAEIAVAVLVGLGYDTFERKVKENGADWIRNNYDRDSVVSKGFNYLQSEFCCCGVENYRDYQGSKYINDSNPRAPISPACCKPKDEGSQDSTVTPENPDKCYTEANKVIGLNNAEPPDTNCDSQFRAEGCYDSLLEWTRTHMIVFIAVGAGVAAIQIMIFIFAVCLCIKIGRDEKP